MTDGLVLVNNQVLLGDVAIVGVENLEFANGRVHCSCRASVKTSERVDSEKREYDVLVQECDVQERDVRECDDVRGARVRECESLRASGREMRARDEPAETV